MVSIKRFARLRVVICTPLVLIVASVAAASAVGATWTWSFVTFGSDVWMRSFAGGAGQFDARLGGGGAVAQFRYVPNTREALLAPTFAGEQTDRVMQGVLLGLNVSAPGCGVADCRWNVNQAGRMDGTFERTIAVEQPEANTVDVWMIADMQWYSALDSFYSGSDAVPELTRYRRLDDSVLEIRRVIRLPQVVLNGSVQGDVQFYLENWLPFKRGRAEFQDLALGLDANGNPTWWYKADVNIPNYPWFQTDTTNGYGVVYKDGAYSSTRVVGVAFSTSGVTVDSTSATAENVLNSVSWGNGIGVLPGVRITNTEAGSILDYAVRIVPASKSDAAFVSLLTRQVSTVAPPHLYGPSFGFSGELATIVTRLNGYLTSSAGTRTNHLDSLQQPIEAENYRNGGEGAGYHDRTAGNAGGAYRADNVDIYTCGTCSNGFDVGSTQTGEWLAYNINAAATRRYDFTFTVGTVRSTNEIQLQVDGVTVGIVTLPNTGGYANKQGVTLPNIGLASGAHTVKLVFRGGFTIDKFAFYKARASAVRPTMQPRTG